MDEFAELIAEYDEWLQLPLDKLIEEQLVLDEYEKQLIPLEVLLELVLTPTIAELIRQNEQIQNTVMMCLCACEFAKLFLVRM